MVARLQPRCREGQGDADQSAVEGHPTVPNLDDFKWLRPDHMWLVESYVAEPAANDGAEGDPKD